MGRPINKRYFGLGEGGVGGESVDDVDVSTPITGTFDGTITAVFSDPELPGGVTATGTVTTDGNDDITAIVITNAGSGYLNPPTIAITSDTDSYSMEDGTDGVTITLTNTNPAAIRAEAYVSSANEEADIIKQVASRRFKVATSEGTLKCRLIGGLDGDPSTPDDVGLMMIEAQDSGGNEYNVYKLTAHRATLKQKGAAGHEFDDDTSVPWTFGAATLNETVKILNS